MAAQATLLLATGQTAGWDMMGRIMWRSRWLKTERCFLYNAIRLTRLRGMSERVARGFALGLAVNFFPTFGLGMLVSGFVARTLGGDFVAGLVGGATLSFLWPVLFYLNIRAGQFFHPPPMQVDELADVTEKTVSALVWGKTFTAGAVFNSLLGGLVVYLLLRLLYETNPPGRAGLLPPARHRSSAPLASSAPPPGVMPPARLNGGFPARAAWGIREAA